MTKKTKKRKSRTSYELTAENSDLAAEATERRDRARDLCRDGKFAEAFDDLLFAYEHGDHVEEWDFVDRSSILRDIAKVGNCHAPALDTLRKFRDEREERIKAGEDDYDVVSEWLSLNEYLGEEEHGLAVIEQLDEQGKLSEEVHRQVISNSVRLLLDQKEYRRLGKFLNNFVWHMLTSMSDYLCQRDFPTRFGPYRRELMSMDKRAIREQGLQCFEIALGCRRQKDASKILAHLLYAVADRQTYTGLIKAAANTNQHAMKQRLLRMAKKDLSANDYAKLR